MSISISAQLVNLDEMNPFVRLERISIPAKKTENVVVINGNTNKLVTPTKSVATKSTRSVTAGSKSKTSVNTPPLENHPLGQGQDASEAAPPPTGRCIICRSHYCSNENVKLTEYFTSEKSQMMETLRKLVKIKNKEDQGAWEDEVKKFISEKLLPLCTSCVRTVHNLWSLDSQLELIQKQIYIVVEKIKGAIWLSTKLHKEKQVVKAKFISAVSAVCQVNPRSTLNIKIPPAPLIGACTQATEKSEISTTVQKKFVKPKARRKQGKSPKTVTTGKKKAIVKEITKRPGPASKTVNTASTCVPHNAHPNNANKLIDIIDIKLENTFDDDELNSCPSELGQEDDRDIDDPEPPFVLDSPTSTSPLPQTPDQNPTSSITLKLPNFDNVIDNYGLEESFHPVIAEYLTSAVAEKKRRVRKDPLQTLVEESKDLLIDCRRPRKCAEAAKLSIALQNQSQEETERDEAVLKRSTEDKDPDMGPSFSDNSGLDEEFIEPGKKSSTFFNTRKWTRNTAHVSPKQRRRRRKRKKEEPEGDPVIVSKPEPPLIRKAVQMAIEYEKATEIEHLGTKATKEETSGLWRCWGCQDLFFSQARVKKHIVRSHAKVESKCTYCPLIFESKSDLTKHTSEAHTGERLFICPTCGKTYNNRGSLHWHTTWVHNRITKRGPRTYIPCNICSRRFLNRSKLANHMRTHTGERPFICEICSHPTSTNSLLTIHMKRCHNSEKPRWHPKSSKPIKPTKKTFMCTICERVFVKPSGLKQHMISHTSDRQWKCDVCEHRLINKAALKRHMSLKHPNLVKEKGEPTPFGSKELDVIQDILEKQKNYWNSLPPQGRISSSPITNAGTIPSTAEKCISRTSGSENLVTSIPGVLPRDVAETTSNCNILPLPSLSSCLVKETAPSNISAPSDSFQPYSTVSQTMPLPPEFLLPSNPIPERECYLEPGQQQRVSNSNSFLQFMNIMSLPTQPQKP